MKTPKVSYIFNQTLVLSNVTKYRRNNDKYLIKNNPLKY